MISDSSSLTACQKQVVNIPRHGFFREIQDVKNLLRCWRFSPVEIRPLTLHLDVKTSVLLKIEWYIQKMVILLLKMNLYPLSSIVKLSENTYSAKDLVNKNDRKHRLVKWGVMIPWANKKFNSHEMFAAALPLYTKEDNLSTPREGF